MEATGFNFNTFSEKPVQKVSSHSNLKTDPELRTDRGQSKGRHSIEKTLELSDLTLTATAQQTHSQALTVNRASPGRLRQSSQEGIHVLTALVAQLQQDLKAADAQKAKFKQEI